MVTGFQEVDKPQLDSPKVALECLKLLIALAAYKDFELGLIEIRVSFLQARTFDRDGFIKLPQDQRVKWYL